MKESVIVIYYHAILFLQAAHLDLPGAARAREILLMQVIQRS